MRKDGSTVGGNVSGPTYRPPQAHIDAHKKLLRNQDNKLIFDFSTQSNQSSEPVSGGIDWEKANAAEKREKELNEKYGGEPVETGDHVPLYQLGNNKVDNPPPGFGFL